MHVNRDMNPERQCLETLWQATMSVQRLIIEEGSGATSVAYDGVGKLLVSLWDVESGPWRCVQKVAGGKL